MRRDPLAYLTTELTSLKEQGLYRQAPHPRRRTEADDHVRPPLGRQPLLEQLPRPDDAPAAARARARGDAEARRRHRARSARSPARWTSTWSSNAGSPSSRRPKRSSSSRAALRRTRARCPPSWAKDDVVVSDELNHASIIDGCRLSRAAIKVFPHKDVGRRAQDPAVAAGGASAHAPDHRRRVQHGRRPRSAAGAVRALAEEFGCIMMVDDAHASGVFGANGRGTIDHFGVHGRVDIQVGTLSKAIGVLGGYVAGTRALIEFLYHRARPFLFSTSHPPGGRGRVHRRDRRADGRAADHRSPLGEHALLPGGAHAPRLQHRPERGSDHARDRRRRRARDDAVRSAVPGGRLRAGHRVPDRARRQGPRAHHRHGHAHARRAAVRAGRVRHRSAANSESSSEQAPSRVRLHLHPRSEGRGSRAALHARHARSLRVLRAPHRSERARRPALASPADRAPAAVLHRVHDEALAGAARRLRRVDHLRGRRLLQPDAPADGRRREIGAVQRDHAGPGAARRPRIVRHRVPAGEPAGAARSRRPAVAQERPRDRARHPAGDAAAGAIPRAGRGRRRLQPAGQHRRRRLLRHPAARRRPPGHGGRRRRRQRAVRRRC